ncbi:MAG TPA: Uma2 family endonuclease [Phycisphaerae bacterium]|nr:Uma2 family endonuclease [Phycisphaerae bacterium]
MSTLFPPPIYRPDGTTIRRWTAEEYLRLADLGFFINQRVELIDGEIIQRSPIRNPHAAAVTRLTSLLSAKLSEDRYWVRVQATLALGDESYPEPDIAVVDGPVTSEGPIPSAALLVIEVSDSTLALDRGRKLSLYASANIAEYWVVNVVDREIEVHRSPVADSASHFGHRYALTRVARPGDQISPLLDPSITFGVSRVFA